jgi:hypothetical protein
MIPPEEEPKEDEFDPSIYGMEHLDNDEEWEPEVEVAKWYDW